ncbi:hypothetical protein NXS19_010567 [Fusarium pseudograminearum]|uniref:Uncharacterized protein n=1 Tax=Fusarium pseudograminearum (strain CS3096) TaxID=1028729 RepID=K3VVH0_FUSPC|nr:hypothetical protein FPSE_01380 [Fusarium pseudograminearum CS3096]EKJ78453.1 hypothetical protein FPSE_01380 [Fusarium pseudograminearum CS3096]UZP42751.1 hypothetical protein NXS19_010567 [Fusarium pseudograminearum]
MNTATKKDWQVSTDKHHPRVSYLGENRGEALPAPKPKRAGGTTFGSKVVTSGYSSLTTCSRPSPAPATKHDLRPINAFWLLKAKLEAHPLCHSIQDHCAVRLQPRYNGEALH